MRYMSVIVLTAVLLVACSSSMFAEALPGSRPRLAPLRPEAADINVLWECAVCPLPGMQTAAVSPGGTAAVVTTAQVLQVASTLKAAGAEVHGMYGAQVSVAMTTTTASSQAVRDSTCSCVRSRPFKRQLDTQQGSRAMMIDKIKSANPNITGEGVKVGIISDSFYLLGKGRSNCSAVRNATILKDVNRNSLDAEYAMDEGRAMAELICYVAPKVQLYFYTGWHGEAAFAQGVIALKDVGCHIIVDDVGYYTEHQYSPGVITQAIEEVKAAGVAYYGAAGNGGSDALEFKAAWVTTNLNGLQTNRTFHSFGDPSQPFQTANAFLKVTIAQPLSLYLHWDEPVLRYTQGRVGAQTDVNLWLCPTPLMSRGCDAATGNNMGADALTGLNVWIRSRPPESWYVAIELINTTRPAEYGDLLFKLLWGENGGLTIPPGPHNLTVNAATIAAHLNTPGGMAIGAARYNETPGYGVAPARVRSFSALGGTPMYFDAQGNRLPVPVVYNKPDIVAVDGTDTTFFLTNEDDTPQPNFDGTSAAAPHAAAVAALMLQQNTSLQGNPDEVYSLMWRTAYDMLPTPDAVGFDFKTGYGFIAGDALLADPPQPSPLPSLVPSPQPSPLPSLVPSPQPSPSLSPRPSPAPICSGFCCWPHKVPKPDGTLCSRVVRQVSRTLPPLNLCARTTWRCRAGICTAMVKNKPAGTICNDKNPCTVGDRCDGAGLCVGRNISSVTEVVRNSSAPGTTIQNLCWGH